MSKIQTIIEDIKILSLVELAELVDKLQEVFGVTAASLAGPAAAAPAAEAAKTSFKIEVVGFNASEKMKAIRTLRSLKDAGYTAIDLGLVEAKRIVEELSASAPYKIAEEMPKDRADALEKTLKEAEFIVIRS